MLSDSDYKYIFPELYSKEKTRPVMESPSVNISVAVVPPSISQEEDDFDYTLVIEFQMMTIEELKGTLSLLYNSSSESFKDIELLADEVNSRLVVCGYDIKEEYNVPLKKLIISAFEVLKKISHFMDKPSSRIKIIYDNFNKYFHGKNSPVSSPVISPKVDKEVQVPKIMKKAKRNKK